MDKAAKAAYLNSLLGLMTSKETAGVARGNTLADEYNRVYDELIEDIKKEAKSDQV